jgi:hypothetical protein
LKATFRLLYSSLGLGCWGKEVGLEEEGQIYVQTGEGDGEKGNSEEVIIVVNVPHSPVAGSLLGSPA